MPNSNLYCGFCKKPLPDIWPHVHVAFNRKGWAAWILRKFGKQFLLLTVLLLSVNELLWGSKHWGNHRIFTNSSLYSGKESSPAWTVFSLSPTLSLRFFTHKTSKDQIIHLSGAYVILAKNNVSSSGRTWSWLGEILYQHHLKKNLGDVIWEALILTDSREIMFSQFYRPSPVGYMFINLRQPFWPEHNGLSDPHLIVLYWLLIKMLFLICTFIWTHWFILKAVLYWSIPV